MSAWRKTAHALRPPKRNPLADAVDDWNHPNRLTAAKDRAKAEQLIEMAVPKDEIVPPDEHPKGLRDLGAGELND
jgi:hypothetical protein